MELDGLDSNLIAAATLAGNKLVSSEQAIYSATAKGRSLEKAARAISRSISKAIEGTDIKTLFVLERIAVRNDIMCYGDSEKRMNALAGLNQVEQLFQTTSSIEGAKSYLISMNNGALPKNIPSNDVVQRFVKSHKASLTQMIGATASPALKFNRVQRKAALDLIKKEYEKNLNLALGRTAPERSKGREL